MQLYRVSDRFLSRSDFEAAAEVVRRSDLGVRRTPMLLASNTGPDGQETKQCNLFRDVDEEPLFQTLPQNTSVYLKLENTQQCGSFKIRGIASQLHNAQKLAQERGEDMPELVTMSAGNYGRAFAYAINKLGLKATILMPETAPTNRSDIIQGYGLTVHRMPSSELNNGVKRHEQEHGSVFAHSYDDLSLIAGYGSLGQEILEDVPDVDLVLVCCGGGGLLAGVAASLKSMSKDPKALKVYGVEPVKANGMYRSFQSGTAIAEMPPGSVSIASGLSPPSAGVNAFRHVKAYCEGILLLTEDEIKAGVRAAFNRGLVVEPAGAAALAALLTGKLQEAEGSLEGKKIVVVVTGGNVTPKELVDMGV